MIDLIFIWATVNHWPDFYLLEGEREHSRHASAEKGGAILYVKDHYTTKRRVDLEKILYKDKELEYVFVEVVNKN